MSAWTCTSRHRAPSSPTGSSAVRSKPRHLETIAASVQKLDACVGAELAAWSALDKGSEAAEHQQWKVKMICKAAFSDTFVLWLHVKLMRMIVHAGEKTGGASVEVLMLHPKPKPRHCRMLRKTLATCVGCSLAELPVSHLKLSSWLEKRGPKE